MWKRLAATRGELAHGKGGGKSEDVTRWERQEARVATSKVLNKEVGKMLGTQGEGEESPGSGRKGSEDRGEGLSGLNATDKGKGKEIEAVEETLQEE